MESQIREKNIPFLILDYPNTAHEIIELIDEINNFLDYLGELEEGKANGEYVRKYNKQATSITAADVSTTYNINKELVITLKDSKGNPLTGASITVDLNGAKTYTTDKNGQVKVECLTNYTRLDLVSKEQQDYFIGRFNENNRMIKRVSGQDTIRAMEILKNSMIEKGFDVE